MEQEIKKIELKSYEVLGVDVLTHDETVEMAKITADMLFKRNYLKSDAIIDLIKLFNIPDTTENRRFALSMMTFGAAAESAHAKLDKIVEALSELPVP